MRIYRFMSIEEFKKYLNGQSIEGRFDGWTACFLEENIPAREFEPSVKQLTDLTSLNFKSTDFNEQMEELTELISPDFEDGDFEGQLKAMKHLSLSDFMRDVREDAHAPVLVEFETTEAFDQEFNKVIMAYMKYLIQEIQANSYSMDTLRCVSYKIDLANEFRDGVGVDTIPRHEFESVEQVLADLEKATEEKQKAITSTEKEAPSIEANLGIDVPRNTETIENHVQSKLKIYSNIDRQVPLSSIVETAQEIAPLFNKVEEVQSQNHSISKFHGIQHVKNVLLLANYIGLQNGLSDNDLAIIREAAVYHDIAHEKPGHRAHAKMGADWYLQNAESSLNKDEVAFLIEAHELDKTQFADLAMMYCPNLSEQRKEELIKCAEILQDADRLDILRYDIENPEGQRFQPERLNNFQNAELISAVLELNTRQAINEGYLEEKDGKVCSTEKLEMVHEEERIEMEKEFAMARAMARNEIGKATINTETEKKDKAQRQVQQDLQKMQENTQTK